jgi:maltose/moltooligosaccharide transporter
MGAYLGLFNGTICLPQIVAAFCGGTILSMVGSHQSSMMLVAGVSFLIASCCVFAIRGRG